jgi:hypothetical protein
MPHLITKLADTRTVNHATGEMPLRSALVIFPDAVARASLVSRTLPSHQRTRWRRYFEHLVFRLDEDPAEHLPGDLEDLISQPNGEQVGRLRNDIDQKLITKYRD